MVGTISDKVSIEDVDIGPHTFTAADFSTINRQQIELRSRAEFGVVPSVLSSNTAAGAEIITA